MATLKQLAHVFSSVGERIAVLPLQNGMAALLTQRGARVLGLFTSPDSENLLWTHSATSEAVQLQAFIGAGNWNLGGERCWIAPELQYNVRDRGDFWGTLTVPEMIDPGKYSFNATEHSVRWEQEMRLQAYNRFSPLARL